jgi:hypothetical protein
MMRRRYAHRLADWSLLAGLVLGCGLAGPTARADESEVKATPRPASSTITRPGQTSTNVPEIADLGAATPRALVESMAKVIREDGKPHGSLGFQPPANRAQAKAQLEMALQIGAKAKALTALVQARIGRMEAGMIKSMEGGVNAGGELVLRYPSHRPRHAKGCVIPSNDATDSEVSHYRAGGAMGGPGWWKMPPKNSRYLGASRSGNHCAARAEAA